jgi:hypothetical protein
VPSVTHGIQWVCGVIALTLGLGTPTSEERAALGTYLGKLLLIWSSSLGSCHYTCR